MSRRFIVQRATTRQVLHWELPIDVVEGPLSELSGPGELTGTLPNGALGVQVQADGLPLLAEWGSLIFEEADGIIRWGGIVTTVTPEDGGLEVEAAGFMAYPHEQPFLGVISEIGIDPAEIIRRIWAHLQGFQNGDLGVEIVGSTPIRVGTVKNDDDPDSGPYELHWADSPDCGSEIDSLLEEHGIDAVEEHFWDGDTIRHRIVLHYPGAGRRRDDLSFVEGVNVLGAVAPESIGDDFANAVIGIGAGEGADSLRRETAIVDRRLRRAVAVVEKDVTTASRLDAVIAAELTDRTPGWLLDEIEVEDHPHAPIGSWALGDLIRVRARVPLVGEIDEWCRVVGWERVGESKARLMLERG